MDLPQTLNSNSAWAKALASTFFCLMVTFPAHSEEAFKNLEILRGLGGKGVSQSTTQVSITCTGMDGADSFQITYHPESDKLQFYVRLNKKRHCELNNEAGIHFFGENPLIAQKIEAALLSLPEQRQELLETIKEPSLIKSEKYSFLIFPKDGKPSWGFWGPWNSFNRNQTDPWGVRLRIELQFYRPKNHKTVQNLNL